LAAADLTAAGPPVLATVLLAVEEAVLVGIGAAMLAAAMSVGLRADSRVVAAAVLRADWSAVLPASLREAVLGWAVSLTGYESC
jgi:predicted ATP-grasp superfamily ATP-dependent carboligase